MLRPGSGLHGARSRGRTSHPLPGPHDPGLVGKHDRLASLEFFPIVALLIWLVVVAITLLRSAALSPA
jgi:hypothetical protein